MNKKWRLVCTCYRRDGKCVLHKTPDRGNTEQPIQDIVYEANGWRLVDNPINVRQPR